MNVKDIDEELAKTLSELSSVQNELEALLRRQEELFQRQEKLIHTKNDLEIQRDEVIARTSSHVDPDSSFLLNSTPLGGSIDWERGDFPWTSNVKKILRSTFKIDQFRPLQASCINATLSSKDTFLIMPTGAGKSLCYQLPAVVNPGLTLVISPLVSLMEDQLLAVRRLGIEAATLNASTPQADVSRVHSTMVDEKGSLKILYVTPEKIAKSKRFMSKLEKCYEIGGLSRIVIDEVHCASQWGHDFRPDYKILGILKRQFPFVPLLGLTATATATVLEDIKQILCLKECLLFRASYNRANLVYEVRLKKSSHRAQMEALCALIKRRFPSMSGIVYCLSRKDSEEVATDLCQQGIKAACYHADLPPAMRSRFHSQWLNNSVKVIVATIAFGMGIDKPDVRFVVHHSLSKSIENYYQESGRAGRDGSKAHCILYFRAADCFRLSAMVFTDHTGLQKLYAMLKYCLNKAECRRAVLARSFGDTWKESDCNEACDVCSLHPLAISASQSSSTSEGFISGRSQRNKTRYICSCKDISSECRTLIEVLSEEQRKNKRVTANKLVELWRNKLKRDKKSIEVEDSEEVLLRAIVGGVLKEDFHYTPYSTISYMSPGPEAEALRRGISRVTIRVRVPDTTSSAVKQTPVQEGKGAASSSEAIRSHCVDKDLGSVASQESFSSSSSSGGFVCDAEEEAVGGADGMAAARASNKRCLPIMMVKSGSEEFIAGSLLPVKRRKSDFTSDEEGDREIIDLDSD